MITAITIKEGSEGGNDEDGDGGNEIVDGESRIIISMIQFMEYKDVPCTILSTLYVATCLILLTL